MFSELEQVLYTEPSEWHMFSFGNQRQLEEGTCGDGEKLRQEPKEPSVTKIRLTHEDWDAQASQEVSVLQSTLPAAEAAEEVSGAAMATAAKAAKGNWSM